MSEATTHHLEAVGIATGAASVGPGVMRVWANLSLSHIRAAATASRRVKEAEEAYQARGVASGYEDALVASIACVISSAASVEAYINEVFFQREQNFPSVPGRVADEIWCNIKKSKNALDKYDLALVMRDKEKVDRNDRLRRECYLLNELRNSVVHYKPELVDEPGGAHASLSGQLKPLVQATPLISPPDQSLFPRMWASHSCTSWAVRTARDFILAFEARAGIPPRFGTALQQLDF